MARWFRRWTLESATRDRYPHSPLQWALLTMVAPCWDQLKSWVRVIPKYVAFDTDCSRQPLKLPVINLKLIRLCYSVSFGYRETAFRRNFYIPVKQVYTLPCHVTLPSFLQGALSAISCWQFRLDSHGKDPTISLVVGGGVFRQHTSR